VDDTIALYQKYKYSENADKECITHLREAVSRKSKRMMEAGEDKIYGRKQRDILREMLDSKYPILKPQPGKDGMDIDKDDLEDNDSDEERDAKHESDMDHYYYNKEPTHHMVGEVTDEIPEEFDYTSEDLGL